MPYLLLLSDSWIIYFFRRGRAAEEMALLSESITQIGVYFYWRFYCSMKFPCRKLVIVVMIIQNIFSFIYSNIAQISFRLFVHISLALYCSLLVSIRLVLLDSRSTFVFDIIPVIIVWNIFLHEFHSHLILTSNWIYLSD